MSLHSKNAKVSNFTIKYLEFRSEMSLWLVYFPMLVSGRITYNNGIMNVFSKFDVE